jgi:peptidoglycan hydrolase-like protein with peptidoglycan-binding domain
MYLQANEGFGQTTYSFDVSKAVSANARYGKELGWQALYGRIANVLGLSWLAVFNPISFAEAVARWQKSRGLPPDGIIGPKTWLRLQSVLGIQAAPTGRSPAATPAGGDDAKFKYHAKLGGYSRYGGGRVYDVLKALRDSGRLGMSDEEIEMLQRISNVETGGAIQALNSWDDVYMSIGFMQWPVAFDKLQRLIQRAPEAFRKYGIELDLNRRYRIRRKYGDLTPIAIKGAQDPRDLRSLDWAKRFYAAGLDPDIIVEEAKLALEVINESKNKIQKKVGDGFLPYYNQSVALRALIQETYNHRPAWLYQILKSAVAKVQSMGRVDVGKFMEIFRNELMKFYTAKNMTKSAVNLIEKTSRKP